MVFGSVNKSIDMGEYANPTELAAPTMHARTNNNSAEKLKSSQIRREEFERRRK